MHIHLVPAQMEVAAELEIEAVIHRSAQTVDLSQIENAAILLHGRRVVEGRIGAAAGKCVAQRQLNCLWQMQSDQCVSHQGQIEVAGAHDSVGRRIAGPAVAGRAHKLKAVRRSQSQNRFHALGLSATGALHGQPDKLLTERVHHVGQHQAGVLGGDRLAGVAFVIDLKAHSRRPGAPQICSHGKLLGQKRFEVGILRVTKNDDGGGQLRGASKLRVKRLMAVDAVSDRGVRFKSLGANQRKGLLARSGGCHPAGAEMSVGLQIASSLTGPQAAGEVGCIGPFGSRIEGRLLSGRLGDGVVQLQQVAGASKGDQPTAELPLLVIAQIVDPVAGIFLIDAGGSHLLAVSMIDRR